MPQATRKDPVAQRAQDKESKRARGALSCAECRRLKLKCDKTVPCSSCKRRGCSEICPNGSLITGQGTRFVLADTEKLHQKIGRMSDRIRQLEDALAILQSTLTVDPHPLLQRDLLKIKSSIELHAAVNDDDADGAQEDGDGEDSQYIDAFGTLAIRDDGAATFYGRSAGSESLLMGEAASPPDSSSSPSLSNQNGTSWQADGVLPTPVTDLSNAFPLPATHPGIDLDYLLNNYLPSWEEGSRLCGLYLEQAPWFFGAVTRIQLYDELLPQWYQQASRPSTARPSSSSLGTALTEGGTSYTQSVPVKGAPDNMLAEQYYNLTKASLSLEPVLERPPSVATVQTLSLMAIYEGLRSGENSIESTWALMGMATKLAQSIGLHRDCARWKLSPAEVQKRRALFWELFITDCWQSLATGRLATFSLPFVDCELPSDPDQTMSDDGSVQPSFPFWKARFGAECVSAVVQGTLTSRAPKYSIILELDRKVRDMEFPKYAQGPPPEGAGLSRTMSHFMPTNYRELTLLYIHRCFFAHAISSNPGDPIKSQYAPSFLAGYRSACDLLASVRHQFTLFPAQIARFWVLWTHAFSSAVMISSVVTHGSKSKVAPAALLELKGACDLFEKAATYGGRAVKFLPIIRRLQEKAQRIYYETSSGIPPRIPNDIFRPSNANENADEMSIFSGKTHTLNTKVNAAASSSRSSSARSLPSTSSRSASDSPPQLFTTTNPSFSGVHPNLVQELNGFDLHINAQIQNAYKRDTEGFTQILMGPQTTQHQAHYPEQSQENRFQYHPQYQQHTPQVHAQRQDPVQQRVPVQQQTHAPPPQQHLQQMPSQQQLHHVQRPVVQTQQMTHAQPPIYGQEQRHQGHQQQQQPNEEYQHYQDPQMSYPTPSPVEAHPAAYQPHHTLRHSQSRSDLHQVSFEEYQQSYAQHGQPQHEMYTIPPEYYGQHQSPLSPEPISMTSSHHHASPESVLQAQQALPHSVAAHHWPEVGTNGSRPPTSTYPDHRMHYQQTFQHQQQGPHYTPEGAMRGIAAEDNSLQETWQSYMSKVGSPRLMLED